MLAPIDYQRLAGGRVRFVRREKTYSVRDSFGRENARILLKRRVHRAGRDRVYPDAIFDEPLSETLCQIINTAL